MFGISQMLIALLVYHITLIHYHHTIIYYSITVLRESNFFGVNINFKWILKHLEHNFGRN